MLSRMPILHILTQSLGMPKRAQNIYELFKTGVRKKFSVFRLPWVRVFCSGSEGFSPTFQIFLARQKPKPQINLEGCYGNYIQQKMYPLLLVCLRRIWHSALLHRMSELVQQRQTCPWLWSDAVYKWTRPGREHEACLKILHDFTSKVHEQERV